MNPPIEKECDVSVIIPTFNRLRLLREAVASVLHQTLSPREIIIVDDGSTDGTWEWLQGLVSERIKIFHQNQQGPGPARNFGVKQARSSWIGFLDSDDLWLPKKLETQWDFLQNNFNYKICQTEEIWYRRGIRVNPRKKHVKTSGKVFSQCIKLCMISPSAVLLEKDFFEKLGGFDPNFPVCEDYELWLRASLKTLVKTLPQALIVKRGGHSDQLSRKYWGMDRFRIQALEKIFWNHPLQPEQKRDLMEEWLLKLSILSKGFTKRYPGETNPYQEKLLSLQEKIPMKLFKKGIN